MTSTVRGSFYTACLLVWLAVGLVPGIRGCSAENALLEENFFRDITLLPAAEVRQELQAIWNAEPGARAEEYYSALKRIRELRLVVQKADASDELPFSEKAEYRSMLLGFTPGTVKLSLVYTEKFGSERMAELGREFNFSRHELRAAAMFPYARWMYLTGLPFAFLVLLVRLDACGFSVLVELLAPWRLALAVIFWPVGLFRYPTGVPAEQLMRGLRFATFILGTTLSGFTGVAHAQTKPQTQKDKKDDPHTLQLDFRVSEAVAGSSGPDAFGRATLTLPSGWYLESVSVASEGFWMSSNVLGCPLHERAGLSMNAVAGVVRNSTGVTTLTVGSQLFWIGKRGGLALPLLAHDRQLNGEGLSFAVGGQTWWKTSRWRVGGDFSVRKVLGKGVQWHAGPLLGRSLGKTAGAEVAILRNSQGEWRLRGRATLNLAW